MTFEFMYEIYVFVYINIYATPRKQEREGKREAFGMSERDPGISLTWIHQMINLMGKLFTNCIHTSILDDN